MKIQSVGVSLPPRVLTNYDLEKIVETSDEWIVERTGIRERRIADKDVSTSDLAYEAAASCLDSARVSPSEIDLIIVASGTPDHMFPATACIVQNRLGARKAGAFDLEIACSGFVYALATGAQFVSSGAYNNVLVIGAETLSRFTDWSDRNTCVLFGDGAGAALLCPGEGNQGIMGMDLGSAGESADLLCIPAGGARMPASPGTIEEGLHYMKMDGKAVFKFAVRIMNKTINTTLKQANKSYKDVDLLIPHQANLRIINSACQRTGIPRDKVVVNIGKYGNTSSASVPLAMYEALKEGRIKRGDLIVLVAFGAGLSWGSLALIW